MEFLDALLTMGAVHIEYYSASKQYCCSLHIRTFAKVQVTTSYGTTLTEALGRLYYENYCY